MANFFPVFPKKNKGPFSYGFWKYMPLTYTQKSHLIIRHFFTAFFLNNLQKENFSTETLFPGETFTKK